MLSHIDDPSVGHLRSAFYSEDGVPWDEWGSWLSKWWERAEGSPDRESMMAANPKYVLRNWMAQLAIDAADKDDYSVANELHELLKKPYDEQEEYDEKWFEKRPEWARTRVGCSMLSCSS